MPLYICLRVSTSLTGRRICLAAKAASSWCGHVVPALPNAPPTNGEITLTWSPGDAEGIRICLLRPADALHLVPHGEPIAVPARDGRRDLHWVVVVAQDRVVQICDH